MSRTTTDDRKTHWDRLHGSRAPDAVTWFQAEPAPSLDLIARAQLSKDATLIDVGGGVSTLVDHLLDRGFANVTVLDVSAEALGHTRERLGDRASTVTWRVADLLSLEGEGPFDLWHDRAVFHFLTDPRDRRRYAEVLHDSLAPGGFAVVSTFAHDGPERCSGLPVVRYTPEALLAELGAGLELLEQRHQVHVTPTGGEQRFLFCLFRHADR